MLRLISFLFIFLVSITGYSQIYFESNAIISENITYSNLQDEGSGKKIFAIIGQENNLDVQRLSLNIKARLLIRISKDNYPKVIATISLTKINIAGNFNVRDFNVDSILWPSGFIATINLYNGKDLLGAVPIKGLTSGQQTKLDLSEYITSDIEKLRANISEIQFYYNISKVKQLQDVIETISYYYSYWMLLENLLNHHDNISRINNQSVAEIFINKIEVYRVMFYINKHNFSSILNLEKYDPIGFLKLTKKLNRLNNRVTTLANQQMKGVDKSSLDPYEFCNKYCELSTKNLSAGNLLQPDDASGYKEFASIVQTKSSKKELKLIIDYFYKNLPTDNIRIDQCIFNKFVDSAQVMILDGNFTDAILLLNNSIIIKDWSQISTTQKFRQTVLEAIDGISSSCLRVGYMAISTHNQEIALSYLAKADKVFENNQYMLSDIDLPDTAFNDYLGLQHDIAMKYIDLNEYLLALDRLNKSKDICSKLPKSINCVSIDSAIYTAHSGYFDLLLNDLDSMIEAGQYPDAYEQLIIARQYKYDNSKYLNNEKRLQELSYSLFLVYLQQGEILIDAQQPEIALENLLKARLIQYNSNQEYAELKKLIKVAAEPVIINLIDEATYHTWANRIEEAESLKQEAVTLNEKYFLNNNSKINQSLKELDLKMQLRYCLSYEIKYIDAINKARIAIKNKQFYRLGELLDEAESYIVNYPQCNIQIDEVIELKDEYSSVLTFYGLYNDILENIFNKGYNGVIEKYNNLIEYYDSNNIYHYDIYFPNLETFVQGQNLLTLTKTTSEYFLRNEEFEKSLHYIIMFKNQGGTPKSAANINNELGKAIGKNDNKLNKPIKESLFEYTLNDKWFKEFRKSYLKNRKNNAVY